MSSHSRPAAPHLEPVRVGNLYRLAIVGAGSLKGKEVAEALNDRNFPSIDIKLLDDDESLGQLETVRDEITFIQSVRSEQFDHVDFTFFASDAECPSLVQQILTNKWSNADIKKAIQNRAKPLPLDLQTYGGD